MTISLDPSVLPDAQTFVYTSDYVQVVDYDELTQTNTVIAVSNVSNISFSIGQPNVTITVANNKIWFNGYYTTGQSDAIKWVEAKYAPEAYGNDIANTPTIVYTFTGIPPRKYLYDILQANPAGVTVTHNFTANTGNGQQNFSIDRFVQPGLYYIYNFLLNYEWYTE